MRSAKYCYSDTHLNSPPTRLLSLSTQRLLYSIIIMGRKGTRATAGHMPLTHYERTHKFAADYGTQSLRLSAAAHYQIGTCALTTQSLLRPSTDATTATALCSPSGYLYDEGAILEYLLQQTVTIKRKQEEETVKEEQRLVATEEAIKKRKRQKIDAFQNSQQFMKKSDHPPGGSNELHRVSYWLSAAQPTLESERHGHQRTKENGSDAIIGTTLALTTTSETAIVPPDRPLSPMTQEPLLRRDLWPVQLDFVQSNARPRCAISEKPIGPGAAAVAYWTEPKPSAAPSPGRVVLQSVYDALSLSQALATCPLTDRRIRQVRTLQRGGSSFAAASGGRAMVSTQYTPTIT
jgi:Zinc-finger of nitric oxide synthase-interacting protein